ncbi:hypothetical protein E1H12_18460 [Geitlerinema sp. P-1104]|uniref:hypothetical protein n=1 Tax=Geitlerinema sp. P-1104 TaxID=2546230 RepID=UPI0014768267|nr:hypothetical protein [Geitlerinema sp. P-1104]NMG60441.1 hypothetical protein [Geitlerinema sp. P-1104]
MKTEYKPTFLKDLKALKSPPRALTLATITNPIKLPKRKDLDSVRKPLKSEESIRLSLTKERYFFGQVYNEELELE